MSKLYNRVFVSNDIEETANEQSESITSLMNETNNQKFYIFPHHCLPPLESNTFTPLRRFNFTLVQKYVDENGNSDFKNITSGDKVNTISLQEFDVFSIRRRAKFPAITFTAEWNNYYKAFEVFYDSIITEIQDDYKSIFKRFLHPTYIKYKYRYYLIYLHEKIIDSKYGHYVLVRADNIESIREKLYSITLEQRQSSATVNKDLIRKRVWKNEDIILSDGDFGVDLSDSFQTETTSHSTNPKKVNNSKMNLDRNDYNEPKIFYQTLFQLDSLNFIYSTPSIYKYPFHINSMKDVLIQSTLDSRDSNLPELLYPKVNDNSKYLTLSVVGCNRKNRDIVPSINKEQEHQCYRLIVKINSKVLGVTISKCGSNFFLKASSTIKTEYTLLFTGLTYGSRLAFSSKYGMLCCEKGYLRLTNTGNFFQSPILKLFSQGRAKYFDIDDNLYIKSTSNPRNKVIIIPGKENRY